MYRLLRGDVLSFARHYHGPLFHALFCDPPYNLESITKRFKKPSKLDYDYDVSRKNPYRRTSSGFMNAKWDTDIAFWPETWEAFSKVLFPGAFIIAFGGSRTYHRMAVAMEDAGLILHPSIFGFAYGSGFPKATRVGDRQEIWKGHRYGGQALKPALEPILVAQKLYDGRPVDNIVETGAGALNIDESRIPTEESVHAPQSNPELRRGIVGNDLGISRAKADKFQAAQRESIDRMNSLGRWPSNFILLDQEASDRLDEQSGELGKSSGGQSGHEGAYHGGYKQKYYGDEKPGYGDSGGASRYFYQVQEVIDESDPIYYCAKASVSEREAGLNDIPERAFGYSGGANSRIAKGESEYIEGQDIGLNRIQHRKNSHPTLKPIDLTRYLATLLLPPPEYAPRRLFVPFAGVASEMIGAVMAGWDCVVGVEGEAEYVKIGKARLDYWNRKPIQQRLLGER